jgi:hypothetical protein
MYTTAPRGLSWLLARFVYVALVGGGWLGLTGCNSHPAQSPATAAPQQPALPDTTAVEAPPASAPSTEPVVPPIKLEIEAGKPPYRMLPGKVMRYHRYVGRLGTQPVVVELTTNPEKHDMVYALSGGYYDTRRGKTTELSSDSFNPHRRLRFTAYPTHDSIEHWQAQQQLGPWLTGTVTAAGKPSRRFVLRENYQEAVPLAIRTATMYGRPVVAEFGDRGEPGPLTGSYKRQYVQLLGSAARRPELQRIFPSRPAQVRARLRQEFQQGKPTWLILMNT